MADPAQAAAAMQEAPPSQEQAAPGGASKLVADIHSGLLKLQELIAGKFPEDAQQLGGLIQGYQSFVDGLGQPAGQSGPPQMGATTPEAGAANVVPAL